MTRKEIVEALKREAHERINSIIRSAMYVQRKKKTMPQELKAFITGLEHAKAVLESMDLNGHEYTNQSLTRKVRRMRKDLPLGV